MHNYLRVTPRDLFNEGAYLTTVGRLSMNLMD